MLAVVLRALGEMPCIAAAPTIYLQAAAAAAVAMATAKDTKGFPPKNVVLNVQQRVLVHLLHTSCGQCCTFSSLNSQFEVPSFNQQMLHMLLSKCETEQVTCCGGKPEMATYR